MASQIRLRLLPSARCLFDEPIRVKVAGLKSRQVVTMRARSISEKGVVFSSSATYRADGSGEVDLERYPSLSGSYVGVEPMGLLWSMRADAPHKCFFKNQVLNPHVVKFSVHEVEGEGRMLAEATNERFLIGDGVSRVPVKEGNFHGVLFTPPGEGPFPAVLDLCSYMSEMRACLLANKGFVVLVVAVLNDNFQNIKEIHLDYFKEAVDFLQQQQQPKSKEERFAVSEDMASQIRLRLLPSARCLFDEPIRVKVAGLKSRQVVTMRARSISEKGVVFSSSATYRADGSGEVDLERYTSLSGSYVGVEPMGLLWSMRADAPHKCFFKSQVLNPHVVKFSVHEVEGEGRKLAEATNERFLIGDGVSRVPVKEGNFHGVLFTPPGEGPFPAVLDLCSYMSEMRACLLANKGFVVLVVAVLNDNFQNIKEMHLDYFKEAVDFLQQQPKVGNKGVGILSRSKGGDIALSLAAFVPGVEAVVWINGCSANVAIPLYYNKSKILSPLLFDFSKAIHTESGASIVKYVVKNPLAEENQDTLVPIEKAKGHFLFVASEDDLNWDSKAYMDYMVERLKRHGKKNFESVCYPGAGHYLEPPYGPYCPSSFHGIIGKRVMWGGEPSSHAAAEVHMWKKIQEFFRSHLSCETTQTEAKL